MKKKAPAGLIPLASVGVKRDPVHGARVGRVVDLSATGQPRVEFEGNPGGPTPARSMVALTRKEWVKAAAERKEVVLLFDGGDPSQPIVAGLVQPLPGRGFETVLESAGKVPETVEVDGQRVVIEGKDEIVLHCGEASITLRRNGKVILRGTYLESYSKGTNRIKGGAVKIN
jgi:hypothetical protein